MNSVKVLLSAALVFVATVSVAQDFSDPKYAPWGDTPEVRKENLLTSNLLREAVDGHDYNTAAGYFRKLAERVPAASEATFIRGAIIYSEKVQRAKTIEEKEVMLDSLMKVYDLRVQYFPDSRNYGTAYVLDRKAREYMTHNPGDREGVRRMCEEAVAAGLNCNYESLSEVAVIYFKNLCDDYTAGEVYPDVVLGEYERLTPIFAGDDPVVLKNKENFDICFALSGVANCDNLEKLFRARLEATPDDAPLLKQAVSLMSRSRCDSPYFFQIAEKYYKLDPSAQTAMLLAQGFQEAGDYSKATTYLREALATEKDVQQRKNLLIRIGMIELTAGRPSSAAAAALDARAIDPNDGMAYFVLAQAYAASASSCPGLEGQAIYWVAYDTMSQAANQLVNDPSYGQAAREAAANYRRGFPTAEECFFNELREGARYTITCGIAKGITTTVRVR